MSWKLAWDRTGEKRYETGIDHGVLYPYQVNTATYDNGVAWNGLISVSETPSGAESNPQYADNIKYLDLLSAEQFGATLECFTYPDEWELCDGTASPVAGVNIRQQARSTFGLSYRTKIGNDINDDLGYKLHLVYNCKATPSERAYNTVNDSPEAIQFSYEISTTPVNVTGYKATSIITIDSTRFVSDEAKAKLTALENVLYGQNATEGSPAVYALDEGSTFDITKTYYTKAGDVYTEFVIFEVTSDPSFQPGTTYYERSGSAGNYTYTPTADDTMDSQKTYYVLKAKDVSTEYYTLVSPAVPATEAVAARLPFPDEVISILGSNG